MKTASDREHRLNEKLSRLDLPSVQGKVPALGPSILGATVSNGEGGTRGRPSDTKNKPGLGQIESKIQPCGRHGLS